MTPRRPIWVGLLLAAFVAGGVLGPVVHRAQHGVAQADAPAVPCHSADVHKTEGTFWTDAADDRLPPECDLCARRLLLASPTPAPFTAPLTVAAVRVESPSHMAPAHVAADHFIRGPPSLPEARPV